LHTYDPPDLISSLTEVALSASQPGGGKAAEWHTTENTSAAMSTAAATPEKKPGKSAAGDGRLLVEFSPEQRAHSGPKADELSPVSLLSDDCPRNHPDIKLDELSATGGLEDGDDSDDDLL